MAHTRDPNTWEAEAGGSEVQSDPWLQSEFKASWGYYVRPCLKTKQKQTKKTPRRKEGQGGINLQQD